MSEVAPRHPPKVALVTGGSGGIGRAVVEDLAGRGYAVALTYRSNKRAAEEVAARLGKVEFAALEVDVADWNGVRTATDTVADRFGGIDLVVHAAGARVAWQHLADLDVGAWHSYIAADLSGAFHVLRASVPHLRSRGGGQIVLISSIAAQMCQPRNAQGAAAKAGVEAMMRVLAREEARNRIRVNAVSVGLTDTDMGQDALARLGAERAEKVVRAIPLGRMGTPQEVARLVGYLASDDGAYITGKVFQVDGGQFIAA
ncbi:MAG TPA: SDR family oxidoreductase [Hyphomicrobiaceae bacterium]|nr:SDR family oxidoreductase [Hyphomicrobiaceae bacterium]